MMSWFFRLPHFVNPPREGLHLRDQIKAAVATLKSSHLGKTKGRAALYELPWILVMGPSGAGKSEAIDYSELTFPLPRNPEPASPGTAAPSPCRWGFATDGVLLDAPGRYFSAPNDTAEWLEFLRLLNAQRPRGPLEGLLVAVGIDDLLRNDAAAMAKAQLLRRRISEVESAFARKVPVYLVFTKLDLLPGCAGFFEDLTEAERKGPFGATLPCQQGPDFDPVRAVAQQFEVLHRSLVDLGSARLAQHPGNLDRPALATFPLEFQRLGPALRSFTEHLLGNDPYHARPFIRGFYFTSASRQPDPGLAAVEPVLSDFTLGSPLRARPALGDSRPYFLEGLFREVLFPDRFLAQNLGRSRHQRIQSGWMAAGVALLALAAGAWTWSFVGNRKLCAAVTEELAVARTLTASLRLEERMKALLVLQFRLEQLARQHRDGRPWAMGWGLYQGRELERSLRKRYFAAVSDLMLVPVRLNLESTLARGLQPAAAPRPRPRPRPAPAPATAEPTILRVAHGRMDPPPPTPPYPAQTHRPDLGSGQTQYLYNTFKTYLMLHDRGRMEAVHLADQLPRFWRPFLDGAAARRGDPELLRMAERTIAFYVSQIQEPDLPLIENRPELVAETRRHLRARAHLQSPVEQLYSELKARANTEFEPLTLARILKDRDLDLMAASHAISPCFTREAYEKFFREAFQDAGQRALGRDWVLSAQAQEPRQTGPPDGTRDALETLYKSEYEKEWDSFLQGVLVLGLGDLTGAAAALGRLGDAQQSPLKLVLARAALETAWDNPAELDKSIKKLKDGVLARTERLLGPRNPGPPAERHGLLGGAFAGLSLLATPGEGGAMPLDGYLQLLQKAQTRVGTLAMAGDPGGGSRELLQATLRGASELAEAHAYVETTLLARVDGRDRERLRPILLRPLLQAFATLIPPAEQDLNRAWTQQVWGPWSTLAHKYPFADSANEATLAEVQKFLKPGEGTLARFVDQYLGALVTLQGDQLRPRFWAGRGVAFREDFLRGVSRLIQASSLLQEAAVSRFELQPVPSPGLREILLEIDGQKLHYRNGPQTWTAFSWPGQSSLQGARLQVVSLTGASAQVQNAPGRMGLLRALDNARTEAPGSALHTLEWPFQPSQAFGAGNASEPRRVRFNYRLVSGPDPLALSALRHHTLPPKATP